MKALIPFSAPLRETERSGAVDNDGYTTWTLQFLPYLFFHCSAPLWWLVQHLNIAISSLAIYSFPIPRSAPVCATMIGAFDHILSPLQWPILSIEKTRYWKTIFIDSDKSCTWHNVLPCSKLWFQLLSTLLCRYWVHFSTPNPGNP